MEDVTFRGRFSFEEHICNDRIGHAAIKWLNSCDAALYYLYTLTGVMNKRE